MKNYTPSRQAAQIGFAAGYGNVWTWVAIDADTKLVPDFTLGNRYAELRVTPAMEADVTDHVWSVDEMVSLLG